MRIIFSYLQRSQLQAVGFSSSFKERREKTYKEKYFFSIRNKILLLKARDEESPRKNNYKDDKGLKSKAPTPNQIRM